MRPESDIIGGRTLGWIVDDSHHVVIGGKALPVGDLTYFDAAFYSDKWQILYRMHNRGSVSGLIYNALYDRDRGGVMNDIYGHGFHVDDMNPCVESPTYARVYRYNFPNSEWHLSFLVGHAEDGKFVVDDGVNFTLTKG